MTPPKEKNNKEGRNELFVRSIPSSVTNQELEDFFSDIAPVKHAIVVKNPETNASKGFGFVSFVSADDAKQALKEASKQKLQGRSLLIEFARPRARKEQDKAPKVEVERRRPRLIIRNVPWSLRDPEELRKIFSKYGTVVDAIIPRGPNKRMSGFAFVSMRRKASAEKAVEECKDLKIHDRPVAVDFAVTKEKYLNQQDESADESGESEDEEEDEDEEDKESDDEEESNDEDEEEDEESDEQPRKRRAVSDNQTIFVRNVPYEATGESLAEHFEQFGPVAYALPVMDKKLNQPKGTAFVAFRSADASRKCVASAPTVSSSSLLIADDVDPRYVYEGRVLSISQAVSHDRAESLAQKGAEERQKTLGKEPDKKDKRNLFLLNEGRVTEGSKLAKLLPANEMQLREQSFQLRKKQLAKNPSLHLSLTRLAIRNLPRSMSEKALKQLGRKAIVEFATEVKNGARHPLSKEELMRSKHWEDYMGGEKKKHGVVKQAKIVQELKGSGETGRSRGYGFLEMKTHKLALMALRWLNGHLVTKEEQESEDATEKRRLVVEFAIENAQVVKRQKERHFRDKQMGAKRKAEQEAKEKASKEAAAEATKKKFSGGNSMIGRKRQMKKRKRGAN